MRELKELRKKFLAAESVEELVRIWNEGKESEPIPAPVPVAAPLKTARALTIPQRRTQKIRGLLRKFTVRPDIDTYGEWMHRAQISPPAGIKSYPDGLKHKAHRAVISAELSRLWRSL